jgi:hypothetical protein
MFMTVLRVFIFGVGLAAASCSTSRGIPAGTRTVFRGHYESRFEVDSFRPCGRNERWWVRHETDELVRAVTHPDGTFGGEVYAELEGTVTDRGTYGHLGAYDRELTVLKVVHVETPRKACDE